MPTMDKSRKRQCYANDQSAGSNKQFRPTVQPYCSICQQHFKTNYVLRRHNATKHALSQLTCTEPGCSETFTRPDALERHVKNQHSDGKIPCPGCGKHFRKDVLQEHTDAPLNWRCALSMSKKPLNAPGKPEDAELRVINKTHTSAATNATTQRGSSLVYNQSLSTGTESSNTESSDPLSLPDLDDGSRSSSFEFIHSVEESERTPEVEILTDGDEPTAPYLDDDMQMSSNLAGPGPLWSSPMKAASCLTSHAYQAESDFWDERMGFGAARAAGSSDMFQAEIVRSATIQNYNIATSDDMLFDMEIEDSADRYQQRLDANQKQWDTMQGRQARNDMVSGSAIRRSIKRYLRHSEFGQRIASIQWGDLCPICGQHAGATERALLRHAQVHIEHVPEPKFKCGTCDIDFVFKTDRQLHCQPPPDELGESRSLLRSDCESLIPQAENCWMLEVTRQDYISELRCWEAIQIKAYLDSVRVLLCRQFQGLELETLRLSEAQVRLVTSFLPKGVTFPNLSCMPRIDAEPVRELDALARSFARIDLEHRASSFQTDQTIISVGAAQSTQCVVSLSPLVRALVAKNTKDFITLLERRHRHICQNCVWYSLCWACGAGNLDAVIGLLESAVAVEDVQQTIMAQGGSSSVFGPGGPLEIAMRYGRHNVVNELLHRGLRIMSGSDVHAEYLIGLAHQSRPTLASGLALVRSAQSQWSRTGSIPEDVGADVDKQDAFSRLERLLRAGLDVRAYNHGETLLNHCIRHQLSKVSRLLLDHGADMTAADANANGYTSLHHAVKTSDHELLRLLLMHRDQTQACINMISKDGVTALVLACQGGNTSAVQALLEARADPNLCGPLLSACDGRHINSSKIASMVNELISASANINIQNSDGITPLMLAVYYKSIPAVRQLVAAGADVLLQDNVGRNALTRARDGADSAIGQVIQSYLVEAFRNRRWALTGLHHVCAMTSDEAGECLKFLVDHGADLDGCDDHGDTFLHYTCKAAYKSSTRDVIRSILLKAKVSVNALNTSGCAPLMLAVNSSTTATAALLRFGALTDLQDNDGNTALHRACIRGLDSQLSSHEKMAIVEMLVHKRARLNLQNADGRTPLMESARGTGGAEISSLLLGAGANPDLQDKAGATALMLAALGGKAENVRALLKAGANVDIPDHRGSTVRDLVTTALALAKERQRAVDSSSWLDVHKLVKVEGLLPSTMQCV